MAAARPLLDNPTGAIRDAQVLIVNDLNVATDPLVKQVYNGGARPRGVVVKTGQGSGLQS